MTHDWNSFDCPTTSDRCKTVPLRYLDIFELIWNKWGWKRKLKQILEFNQAIEVFDYRIIIRGLLSHPLKINHTYMPTEGEGIWRVPTICKKSGQNFLLKNSIFFKKIRVFSAIFLWTLEICSKRYIFGLPLNILRGKCHLFTNVTPGIHEINLMFLFKTNIFKLETFLDLSL